MVERVDTTSTAAEDLRRCWGCRDVRPRATLRWSRVTATAGGIRYVRTVRVLRCPDCLP